VARKRRLAMATARRVVRLGSWFMGGLSMTGRAGGESSVAVRAKDQGKVEFPALHAGILAQ
jgi:hypothetical protein